MVVVGEDLRQRRQQGFALLLAHVLTADHGDGHRLRRALPDHAGLALVEGEVERALAGLVDELGGRAGNVRVPTLQGQLAAVVPAGEQHLVVLALGQSRLVQRVDGHEVAGAGRRVREGDGVLRRDVFQGSQRGILQHDAPRRRAVAPRPGEQGVDFAGVDGHGGRKAAHHGEVLVTGPHGFDDGGVGGGIDDGDLLAGFFGEQFGDGLARGFLGGVVGDGEGGETDGLVVGGGAPGEKESGPYRSNRA